MDARVLVPLKAFTAGKARLAPALGPADRAELARTMAEQVLRAASPLPVAVACDDDGVATWAREHGASVVWTPGLGLNGAVQQGCEELVDDGATHVIVAHADLPRAAGLARLLIPSFAGVTLVPDRRDDGTNVAVVPAETIRAGFTFAYGEGSFARHRIEGERLGVAVRAVRIAELQWDIDTPDDLVEPQPANT